MRKTCVAVCVAGLALGLGGRLWSGEGENAPRKVIDRALKAQGGEDKLAKFRAVTMKGMGKFYGMGDEGIPFTGEWTVQGDDQMRFVIEGRVMDQNFKLVKILNGAKGWSRLNDGKSQPMGKDELQEEKEQIYQNWVAMLIPLRDKRFKLATLGEVKVGKRAAVGVRVSREGRRDVNLYFAKDDGLLIKSEVTVKDIEGGGKELIQEELFDGYKEFQGVKQPTKLTIRRDGKRFVEVEVSELRLEEKVDPSLFAEP
ncbi:MAG: hypothetical protein L0Z62_19685 [Gemmataceae bacterium]|nr:hypothetical protein [Gemmataceae bacterium]